MYTREFWILNFQRVNLQFQSNKKRILKKLEKVEKANYGEKHGNCFKIKYIMY